MTCEHCANGVPHHTNSATSIGGTDRYIVWDLHQLDTPENRGGLVECVEPERAQFPRSILWQTDCQDWHDTCLAGCRTCLLLDHWRAEAARDPVTRAIMLRMEGVPHHGFTVRPVKGVAI